MMTNSANTKRATILSVIALIICLATLTGTTFAWFTDTETSTGNKIIAGNLDVKLHMWSGSAYTEITENSAPIFGAGSLIAQNNLGDTVWEPGKTQIAYLAIENAGNLALKYNVLVDVDDGGLIGALEYAIIPMDVAYTGTNDIGTDWETIEAAAAAVNPLNTGKLAAGVTVAAPNGMLDNVANGEMNETDYFALVIHMDEEAGNEYKTTDDANPKQVKIDITVIAGQAEAELDAFNTPDYDETAPYEETTATPAP